MTSTTATLDRIDMIRGAMAYDKKIGKQPRHRSLEIGTEYREFRLAPKHRKDDSKAKHRRWAIEQY